MARRAAAPSGRAARGAAPDGPDRARAARTKRRSRLRVVKARSGRAGRLPFLVASFLAAAVLVVGVVSVQALVSQTSFRMQELTRRAAQLEQSTAANRLKVAELSSPTRMAREAARLGFRAPGPGELHTITVRESVQAGGPGSGDDPAAAHGASTEDRP
jgi:cell division protein FtsL